MPDTPGLARSFLADATVLVEPSPEYDAWLRAAPQYINALLAHINAITAEVEALPVYDAKVAHYRAAVLAILRGEQ